MDENFSHSTATQNGLTKVQETNGGKTDTQHSPIKSLLNSDDPLSPQAISFILNYKEEDGFLDYKQCFDTTSEREWLYITKDILGFANTLGGYLVFGVQNGTFNVVGLSETDSAYLSDVDKIHQKVNRAVEPKIKFLRSKFFRAHEGLAIVVLYIPRSVSCTHIVTKEMSFTYPNGPKQVVLWPGVIFIRRSGCTQVIDPDDFEQLMERRLEPFKKNLLGNLARVVEAPVGHQVVLLDPRVTKVPDDAQLYKLSSADDAVAIAGHSFTTPPESDEQMIAAWIALRHKDPHFLPRCEELYRLYSKRHELILSREQIESLSLFSLLRNTPVFFWLRNLKKDQVTEILKEAFKSGDFQEKQYALQVSAFLGKGTYNRFLERFSESERKRLHSLVNFPVSGAASLFSPNVAEAYAFTAKTQEDKVKILEEEANKLANRLSSRLNTILRYDLEAIDSQLYANELNPKRELSEPGNIETPRLPLR